MRALNRIFLSLQSKTKNRSGALIQQRALHGSIQRCSKHGIDVGGFQLKPCPTVLPFKKKVKRIVHLVSDLALALFPSDLVLPSFPIRL